MQITTSGTEKTKGGSEEFEEDVASVVASFRRWFRQQGLSGSQGLHDHLQQLLHATTSFQSEQRLRGQSKNK